MKRELDAEQRVYCDSEDDKIHSASDSGDKLLYSSNRISITSRGVKHNTDYTGSRVVKKSASVSGQVQSETEGPHKPKGSEHLQVSTGHPVSQSTHSTPKSEGSSSKVQSKLSSLSSRKRVVDDERLTWYADPKPSTTRLSSSARKVI